MKMLAITSAILIALTASAAGAAPATADVGPVLQSIGPLTFGPGGILLAADNKGAKIFAIELGDQASSGTPGAKDIAGIDAKIASMLGTDAREISVMDLAVEPTSKNAFLAAHRGEGASAKPVLLRVDGAGKLDVIDLAKVSYTVASIQNAPNPDPKARRDPRQATVTDMVYVDGRVFIAGLSNEEFASKLRSVKYPFEAVDEGTSVEIYHGAHGQWETRSPVYTFVPYEIDNEQHLIAGYLCTPLVKFPVAKLAAGEKLVGTTIAELGNRNRPLDMVVYKKDGKDYILMSNTSRGVMKISTDGFGDEPAITEPVGDTAGVSYDTIASMKGIEQLDLFDDSHSIVLARTDAGALNLEKVALP